MKVYNQVHILKTALKQARISVEQKHHAYFNRAKELGEAVGTVPEKRRTCKKQTLRSNPGTNEPEEYYRITLTVPIIDHIIAELDERFNKNSFTVVNAFSVIPSIMVEMISTNKSWNDGFSEFKQKDGADLPIFSILSSEMDIWEAYWLDKQKDGKSLPGRLSYLLKEIAPIADTFLGTYVALKIMATIPVTTCECERSISKLGLLKTSLRNTMDQDRLNGLALLTIHRDMELDEDKIVEIFARKNRKLMFMKNILNTDPDEFSPDC